MWILLAFGSALFAGLTAILAKMGIRNTDTDVATALRTVVVLLFSWLLAWLSGSVPSLAGVSARTWLFLVLSGFATGASWLCYFRALQMGDVNKVTPIDKSSTVLTMLLAAIILGEAITPLKALAMVLIGGGALLMIQKKAPPAALPPQPQADATAVNTAGDDAAAAVQTVQQEAHALPASETSANGSPVPPAKAAALPAPEAAAALPVSENAAAAPARAARPVWLLFAIGSAVFASLTSILGKIGIEGIDSTLGTAVRTAVVLVMAWAIVFMRGKQRQIRSIHKVSHLFLVLSGFATGASWLCYYRALQLGPASVVVPIDKLSILVSIAFSRVVFGERLTLRAGIGLLLLVAGTLSLLL